MTRDGAPAEPHVTETRGHPTVERNKTIRTNVTRTVAKGVRGGATPIVGTDPQIPTRIQGMIAAGVVHVIDGNQPEKMKDLVKRIAKTAIARLQAEVHPRMNREVDVEIVAAVLHLMRLDLSRTTNRMLAEKKGLLPWIHLGARNVVKGSAIPLTRTNTVHSLCLQCTVGLD